MRLFVILSLFTTHVLAQSASPSPGAKFPAITMQATVGTQQRRVGDSYTKIMDIHPKLVVEGKIRLTPLPDAEAIMVVITMDTRAKYVQKHDVLLAHAVETLPVPAAPTGERREFNFTESTVQFDSYRDSSNIGGEVYKYFVCGLRDAATKEIVAFQTNYPALATYCTAHPEKRSGFLNLKKGAKVPTDFK